MLKTQIYTALIGPLARMDATEVQSSDITDILGTVCGVGSLLLFFTALVLYGINKTQSGNGGAVSESLMMNLVIGGVVLMLARTFITGITLW